MATLTATAQIDSHMDKVNPTVNFGAAAGVECGPVYVLSLTKVMRGIGNFDVSSLFNRVIDSAQLEFDKSGVSGSNFAATIYRCTRPAEWTQGGVTWNKYDGSNDWTATGGDLDLVTPTPKAIASFLPVNSLNIITGMKDFVVDALDARLGIVSLIIKADDETATQISETHWVSWKQQADWKLVVEHSPAPPGAETAKLRISLGSRPRTFETLFAAEARRSQPKQVE